VVVIWPLFFEPGGLDSPASFKSTNYKYVNMHRTISIRPTDELVKKLEKLGWIEQKERSALLRRILMTGLEEELKRRALALYRERKVSLAKAAELADISVREMMDLIKERGLALHITSEELREDFEAALR
jgi:predicted HTH domain antitoxin